MIGIIRITIRMTIRIIIRIAIRINRITIYDQN